MQKKYLLAPGPVQVPAEVLLEMAKPIIHHRTPEFEHTIAHVQELLKELFRTQEPVLTFASSGTGAMEAAIVNLHNKGETTAVIRNGKFSERLGLIAEAYELNVEYIDVEDGYAVEPAAVEKLLKEKPHIKSVMLEYSETSTGTMNDLEKIAPVVHSHGALCIVDAITALGVVPIESDQWKLDAVIGGSQKSLMLPPGLAFLWLSERARKIAETANLPRFYFDVREEYKALKNDTTAWTPAISLINGLKVALEMMRDFGWDNLYEKNKKLSQAVQKGLSALGLENFSRNPSLSVSAIKVPEELDGNLLVDKMKNDYGVTIAGGQGTLKGKIFRLGTLGYIDKNDILVFFSALEATLGDMNYTFTRGAGISAVQEALY